MKTSEQSAPRAEISPTYEPVRLWPEMLRQVHFHAPRSFWNALGIPLVPPLVRLRKRESRDKRRVRKERHVPPKPKTPPLLYPHPTNVSLEEWIRDLEHVFILREVEYERRKPNRAPELARESLYAKLEPRSSIAEDSTFSETWQLLRRAAHESQWMIQVFEQAIVCDHQPPGEGATRKLRIQNGYIVLI